MKSFKDIIEHYQKSPKVKLENELRVFRKALFMRFGANKGGLVSFMYIKDDKENNKKILFIALNNPNAKFEFDRDNIKNEIKVFLKMCKMYHLKSNNEISNIPEIDEIKFFYASKFVENLNIKKIQKLENIRPTFFEPSLGKFKNKAKDPEIFEIFEQIREIIIAKRSSL